MTMRDIRFLLCVTALTLCCVQYSEAWWWTWTRGTRTISVAPTIRGFPGVTRDWYVGVRITFNRQRNQEMLQGCSQLASAIVTREEWKAIVARWKHAIDGVAEGVIVWHTGSNTCNLAGLSAVQCQSCLRQQSCTEELVRALQDADFKQGKDDIGYNFLIGQDGVIYEGRGWNVIGQHTPGKNSKTIGVALIGDFGKTEPSQASQDALNSLIVCGKKIGELTPDAKMMTGPKMAGEAFYKMLDRCDGLCIQN